MRVFRIDRRAFALCLLITLIASWQRAVAGCQMIKYAELPVTMAGTVPLIRGSINGMDAVFLADSGAFSSGLTPQSADKFKLLGPSASLNITGVGGSEHAGVILAQEFSLQGFGKEPIPRLYFLLSRVALGSSIDGFIGQNVLGVDGAEYDLANGVIRLFHPKDCRNTPLAYWRGADVLMMPMESLSGGRFGATGLLNGAKIRVMFDSGASHSILKLATAARAGIKPDSPGVVSGGGTGGIGRRRVATWIARFGSLDLGGELIQNARLRIGDIELAEADFLLGADFFLSHRILFAKSQGKVYLTYNGGRVFDLSVIPAADTVTAQDSTVPPAESNTTNSAEAPADAAGYRRRGAALAGRGDLAGAIADLDQAIRLDPADPENFYQRALAHLRNRNVKLATADLDRAIELRATYVDALKERASLRFANQDEVGALADYDAVVGASPADSGAELNIAKTYIDAGKYAGAVHFFDRWVDTHATDQHRAEVLNNRCWTRAMLNQQLELAMADCNASLKLQFGPAPLDSRALVYLRMGDFAHSIADYKFSLARRPSNASSLYGKGLAELRQGNKAQGQKDIDAAVALAPRIAEQFNFVGLTP